MITTPFWYNDISILYSKDSIIEIFPSKRFDILRKLNALFKTIGAVLLIDLFFALLESFTSFRLPVSPYSSLLPYFGKEAVSFSPFDNTVVSALKMALHIGINDVFFIYNDS